MEIKELNKNIEMHKQGMERSILEDVPRVNKRIHELRSKIELGMYSFGGIRENLTEEDLKDDPIYMETKAKIEEEEKLIDVHKNAAKYNMEKLIEELKEKNKYLYEEYIAENPIKRRQKLDGLKVRNEELENKKQSNDYKIQQNLKLIEKYKEIGDTDRITEISKKTDELKKINDEINQEQKDNSVEIALLEDEAAKAKEEYDLNLKEISNCRNLAKQNNIELEDKKVENKKVEDKNEDDKKIEEKKVEPKTETKVEPKKDPEVKPKKDPVVEPKKAPAVEPKKDPVVETKKAPAVEPKKDPVVEPKKAPAVEPKKDPVVEPKKDPVVAPKASGKVDLKDVKIIIGKNGLKIQAPEFNKEENSNVFSMNLKELNEDLENFGLDKKDLKEYKRNVKGFFAGIDLTDEQIENIDPILMLALNILVHSDVKIEIKKEIISRYADAIVNDGKVSEEKSLKGIIQYDKTDLEYWKPGKNVIRKIVHKEEYDKIKHYADIAEKMNFAEVKQDEPGIFNKIGNFFKGLKDKIPLFAKKETKLLEEKADSHKSLKEEVEKYRDGKALLEASEKHREGKVDYQGEVTTGIKGKMKEFKRKIDMAGNAEYVKKEEERIEKNKERAGAFATHVTISDGDVIKKTSKKDDGR